MIESGEDIRKRVECWSLFALLDHSGRGGSGFFLTIFDQHPEVLTCPWVHYIYSYILTRFGGEVNLPAPEASRFLREESYFRYVFLPPDAEREATMRRFGADSSADIDRDLANDILSEVTRGKSLISRGNLIRGAYYSFARAVRRDLSKVRSILVTDMISLRSETPFKGFSGRVADAMAEDFPEVRFIDIVRDPRATFASNRHQFVNQFGNMYDFRPGDWMNSFSRLWNLRLNMHGGCVYLYWFAYLAMSARTIFQIRMRFPERFMTVKNEDLNLDFSRAIKRLSETMGVSFLEAWTEPAFIPTSVGRPWRGTGAYNPRYQTNSSGPISNDPQDVADQAAGPNRHVTERWRTRLAPEEIRLVEILLRDEMEAAGYPFLFYSSARPGFARFLYLLMTPFRGEIPGISWLRKGWEAGADEFRRRLFYLFGFFPFYLLGRWQIMRLYARGFFDLSEIHGRGEGSS